MKLSTAFIASQATQSLDSIAQLSFRSKDITEIEDLSACLSLRSLDLSSNILKTAESLAGLRDCTSLANLNLSGNQLENIDILFSSLHFKPTVLNLSHNNLKTVSEVLGKNSSLKALILNDNQLTIDVSTKFPLHLNSLIISKNSLIDISGILNLKSLTKLSASHGNLRNLPKESLASLVSLKELKLNENKLSSLCSMPPSLEILDLGNNSIKSFSDLEPLKRTKIWSLNLKGNPICKEECWNEQIRSMFAGQLRVLNGERFDPKYISRLKAKRRKEWKEKRQQKIIKNVKNN